MKKLIVVILSILTWFFMLMCLSVCLLVFFPDNEIRGQLAYENIQTAHEIAISLRADIESIPSICNCRFASFTSDVDEKKFMNDVEWNLIEQLNFDNCKSYLCKEFTLGTNFMIIVNDEYGEDLSEEMEANNISCFDFINYFCNESEYRYNLSAQYAALARTIIATYDDTGEIKKAEKALAEADKQLQKLKNEDYEHYEALKEYYDSTITYFDCARLSEVGSDFDSTYQALIHYGDDMYNLLDILFEYEDYLDDVFGES